MRTLGIFVAGATGAAVLMSWLVVAAAHADDAYHMSHSAGVLTALAKYADGGVLYPPLYDGESFGGTRYMPLQILLHAGMSKATGEYLVSGKVVTAIASAVLVLLMLFLLRRARCPLPIGIGLVGSVMVTSAALWVTIGPRADVLAVTLQLAAVTLVAGSADTRRAAGAGVLSALAITAKISAVWAPLAIAPWLLLVRPRAGATFLVAFLGSLFAVLLSLQGVSDGRLSENVFGLALSDPDGLSLRTLLIDTPRKFVEEMQTRGGAVWPLVPFAIFATIVAALRRRLTVLHVAYVAALLVLWVVLTDEGADFYHLIDVLVLTALVVGLLAADVWSTGTPQSAVVVAAIAFFLGWNVAASYQLELGPDTRAVLGGLFDDRDDRYTTTPLAGRVDDPQRLLSEDPFLPVSLGSDPVVLDSFMLTRLFRSHPEWEQQLAARVRRREFDRIVLLFELEDADYRYRELHFGATVAEAVERHYALAETVDDYWRQLLVYAPRPSEAAP